ncbi:MAG TPA: hypothetical protein VFB73_09185 [Chloroflexota bacterium]|nr:hypothetical protein [Chloroflexota bacterium]
MREGLLWYDADRRRPTLQKIDDAARRYRERFGRAPNCCHVHPSEWVAHPVLEVVADATILPHHFWVGVDESRPARQDAEVA